MNGSPDLLIRRDPRLWRGLRGRRSHHPGWLASGLIGYDTLTESTQLRAMALGEVAGRPLSTLELTGW